MALNPIANTEKAIRSFLRCRLMVYPFADPRLHEQMRGLLNLDEVRQTPLMKGAVHQPLGQFPSGAGQKSRRPDDEGPLPLFGGQELPRM
jgi:hypothetical protein